MIKYGALETHAAARPHATALVDVASGRRLGWADLAELVGRAATGLSTVIEDTTRARAAFVAENRWEIVVLAGAAATIGLPLVGVDHSLPAEHVAACLRQVQPSVLVVSPAQQDLVSAALELLDGGLSTTPTIVVLGSTTWAELMDRPVDRASWRALPFEGLGFTSGTTGAPKLVLRSRSFEARRQEDVTAFFGITADDVYLNTVPLYHASGPGWARIFATNGATVVLVPAGDPAAAATALAREKVTASLIVPPALAGILDHLEADPPGTPLAVRSVITGGRHISPALAARCRRLLGDVLHVYYGTTETGLNTLTARGELDLAPTSAGKPFPGNEILILDDADQPLPAGRRGRVAIAGYMLADTYAAAPAPVVDVAGRTAWLTADTGHLDDEGWLHVTARDLAPDAWHVNVVALEAYLKDVLPVADVVVLAGTEITIAYTPGARQDDVLAAAHTEGVDILAFEVPAIPYSPTGKVRVPALRALMHAMA